MILNTGCILESYRMLKIFKKNTNSGATVDHEIGISERCSHPKYFMKALPGDFKEQPPLGMAWID